MISTCFCLAQWLFLAYSQMKLYILDSQGVDVWAWNHVTDSEAAWFITMYLLCFNGVNVCCAVNTYIIMNSISIFIEKDKKLQEPESRSSVQSTSSSFYFKRVDELQEQLTMALSEKECAHKQKVLREQFENFLQAVIKEVSCDDNPQCQYISEDFIKESHYRDDDTDLHDSFISSSSRGSESLEPAANHDSEQVQEIFKNYISEIAKEYP